MKVSSNIQVRLFHLLFYSLHSEDLQMIGFHVPG